MSELNFAYKEKKVVKILTTFDIGRWNERTQETIKRPFN
jgi:hypothetical protein